MNTSRTWPWLPLFVAFCLAATGCPKRSKGDEDGEGDKKNAPAASAAPVARVVVAVTVDWEGAFLSEAGLERLDEVRTELPGVPITHYICPAYFTKAETEEAVDVTRTVKDRVLDGDEVGLHIHPWHSLVARAEVPLRNAPNIYADDEPMMEFDDGDKGYEVALSAYSGKEIEAIITTGKTLLEDAGLAPIKSFRSGGYVGNPTVLAAMLRAGIAIDSSASWYGWYSQSRGTMQNEIKKYWPNVQELTQPYEISTNAGTVLEVPNSGGFVEYVHAEDFESHFRSAMEKSREWGGEPVYVNVGFHQETADEFADGLIDALAVFRAENPGVLEFATVTEIAEAVRAKNSR